MATENSPKPAKTPKKKGPIRWEAIIPFVIFCALVWAYFFFFFDNHLKAGLQYVGTQANGAEVNIDEVETSFWKAELDILNIQITDDDQPVKNKIQIGRVHWKMMWDALLRGKVAIEDSSILEIAIGVPRKKPGRVLPPPPPGEESAFDKVREQALAKAKEEFDKNVLGDVAAILGGVDPAEQLKNIEGQLKSAVRVKELQAELAKKEQEWKDRLARLPQAKDVQALQERLRNVKTSGFSNPQEVQTSLQQLDAIFKEADAKVKEVQATGQAVNGDVGTFQNTLKEFEEMVRKDIKDLEDRIKLPKLDVANLSKSIFGNMFLDKVKQAGFYMDKARTYMPPKKTAEEKAEYAKPVPHEREKGRNFKFGRPNSYPLFWLKNATISSKATKGADWSGDLTGSLKDVTDDPPVLGRPTLATFKGDFPKQEFFDVDGKVTIDHRTDDPVETILLKVGRYPVLGRLLVSSPEVTLGFDTAQASSELEGELRGGKIKLESKNVFKKRPGPPPDQTVVAAASAGAPLTGSFLTAEAKQPILADILKGALADIPTVTLNAGVNGPWSDLKFNINSSLGDDLMRAFDKQVQLKINEARAKLKAMIDERVGQEKEKLLAEFNKFKGQAENLIKEKQAEIDKFKNQIEQAKNDAVNNQKKQLEDQGKKKVEEEIKKNLPKGLPKGLGF